MYSVFNGERAMKSLIERVEGIFNSGIYYQIIK